MTHYFVTGATGFLGRHIVDRLLDRGDAVRALVPEEPKVEQLRRRGVDARHGDLNEVENLAETVKGTSAVIHCAGLVELSASRADLWKVNVNGSTRLLSACARAAISRFVYVSSVAVYGHAGSPIREDAPKKPVGTYGESKWAAEQVLWSYHAEHGLPAVALRPCIIYGPHDPRTWPTLRRVFNMRLVPLPGGGKRILDMVYVSDVVDAVLAAATERLAVGHAYNITDGETHSYRDLLDAYAQITGKRPTVLPVPGRLFVLAIQATLRLKQLGRAPGDWAAQVQRVRGLDLDLHYAIDAARHDLGYAPHVGLKEGVGRTLDWERERYTTEEGLR